jgi:hypothetical protein
MGRGIPPRLKPEGFLGSRPRDGTLDFAMTSAGRSHELLPT